MKYFEVSFDIEAQVIDSYEMDCDIEHEVIAEDAAYEFFNVVIGESNVSKEDCIRKITIYLKEQCNKADNNYSYWQKINNKDNLC